MEVDIANIVNFEKKLSNGLRPQPPASPNNINDLIESCWHSDPKERPTIETVGQKIEFMMKER